MFKTRARKMAEKIVEMYFSRPNEESGDELLSPIALARRIQALARKRRVRNFLSFGYWFAKDQLMFDSLSAIEDRLGEDRAERFLARCLASTGLYSIDDDDKVEWIGD